MPEIEVRAAGGAYTVFVGGGLYEEVMPRVLSQGGYAAKVVVSHPSLMRAHGKRLLDALGPRGGRGEGVTSFEFPPGEENKNLRTLEEGYGFLLREGVTREALLLAFGGGVVGDLAGFLAATYMRGIAWVQVPTTLMAMVDSSIGGKVGVDLPGAKNAVGAFHQPKAVVSDVEVLRTLPERELRSGMAEVVKYGFLYDRDLLREAGEGWRSLPGDAEHAAALVARCARHKAAVVEADERDSAGTRAMLNYGHTFGHALESSAGYGLMRHGEAVALGMMMAARASELAGVAGPGLVEMHDEVLLPLVRGLAVPRGLRADAVLDAMRADKKRGAEMRFVLLEGPERPRLADSLPEAVIRRSLEEVLEILEEG